MFVGLTHLDKATCNSADYTWDVQKIKETPELYCLIQINNKALHDLHVPWINNSNCLRYSRLIA